MKLAKVFISGAIVLLLLIVTVKVLFVGYYRIPQNGMFPQLPAGSVLFTLKKAYSSSSDVKRGDVVAFSRTENGLQHNYIWRVVGLPGDTIASDGDSLSVNGKPVTRIQVQDASDFIVYQERLEEGVSYRIAIEKNPKFPPPNASLTVAHDQFFVMGDNRSNARDSRYLGTIGFTDILGRKF